MKDIEECASPEINQEDRKEDLKPCPFCGCDDVELCFGGDNCRVIRWTVWCHGCDSDSGCFDTEYESIVAWNRRPSHQWTTEPPTEMGWYWFGYSYNKQQRIVHIVSIDDELFVFEGKKYIDTEYIGPYKPESIPRFIAGRTLGKHYWLKIDVPAFPQEVNDE